MVDGVFEQHPILGWIPSAPEPFWVRRWFRWKPACYGCKITFASRDEHDRHYFTTHFSAAESSPQPDTGETR